MKALLFLALLAACGGKSSSTTTTPTPMPTTGSAAEAAKPLPDVPFDDLDQDQREQFMKQKVVPAMKPIFQNHDPKAYADFGCKTCHGKGAEAGHFDMPNPDLPKIGRSTDWSKVKKADLDWMKNEVKPTMAKILQQPEWSPENPKGFGCNECHPSAE
jgi:hypothetical protein